MANIRRSNRSGTDRSRRQRIVIPPSAANRVHDRETEHPVSWRQRSIVPPSAAKRVHAESVRSIRLRRSSDRGLPACSGPRHRSPSDLLCIGASSDERSALTGRRHCGFYRPIAACVAPVERVVRRTSGDDDCTTIDLPTVYGSGPIAANIRRSTRSGTDWSRRQRSVIPPSAANRVHDRETEHPVSWRQRSIVPPSATKRVHAQIDRSIRLRGGNDRGLPAISGPRHRRRVTSSASEHQATNDQRNRAAAVDVDFKFRVIRRSGSRICSVADVAAGVVSQYSSIGKCHCQRNVQRLASPLSHQLSFCFSPLSPAVSSRFSDATSNDCNFPSRLRKDHHQYGR